MQGIQQIIQEVNKKSKLNNLTNTKKVIQAFLETIQQKLVQGENLNFKGYFTLKRSVLPVKGSKRCNKHEKSISDFKQVNKGKDLAFFAKSTKFKGIIGEAKKCKDCQSKKQQLVKSAKPTNRVLFKPSKKFWTKRRK